MEREPDRLDKLIDRLDKNAEKQDARHEKVMGELSDIGKIVTEVKIKQDNMVPQLTELSIMQSKFPMMEVNLGLLMEDRAKALAARAEAAAAVAQDRKEFRKNLMSKVGDALLSVLKYLGLMALGAATAWWATMSHQLPPGKP